MSDIQEKAAAARAARDRLGQDLDRLDTEVRAQMSSTAERAVWNLVGTGGAIVAGLLVRKLLLALWRRVTGHDAPTNPGAPDTSLAEGLVWAIASGAAIGVGRLLAAQGATAGWQRVTGHLPPNVSDTDR